MRTALSILILVTFFTTTTIAQKAKFGIVVNAGFSGSKKSDQNFFFQDSAKRHTNSVKNNFSYSAGVVASIPVSNNIIFRPQLIFIAKGWTTHHDFIDGVGQPDFDSKLQSYWVEVPLNFVYNVPARNGRFFIGLGPSVACAVSAKITDDNGNNSKIVFGPPDNPDVAPNAHRIDVLVNVVGGYEFRNGIFLNLNYERGFIDFRSDPDQNKTNKNIVFGAGIGYMF